MAVGRNVQTNVCGKKILNTENIHLRSEKLIHTITITDYEKYAGINHQMYGRVN